MFGRWRSYHTGITCPILGIRAFELDGQIVGVFLVLIAVGLVVNRAVSESMHGDEL